METCRILVNKFIFEMKNKILFVRFNMKVENFEKEKIESTNS